MGNRHPATGAARCYVRARWDMLLLAGSLVLALLLGGQPLPAGAGSYWPAPTGPSGAPTPGAPRSAGPQGPARIRARQEDPPEPPRPDTVVAGNWTNFYPDLYAVSALADGEVWAAGEYGHLLHYTGSAWVAADPANLRGIDLWDIKMLTTQDGWIPAGAQAFEYNGSDWVARSAGLGPAPGLQVGLVAPLASGDVWGIGHQADHDTVLHWDGNGWAATGPLLPSSLFLYDMAMVSDAEGWAVGDEAQNGGYVPAVFHYDGASWTRLAGPPQGRSLFSIWANRPGDAWMVGTSDAGGQIYHYLDGAWTSWAPPDGSQPFRIFMASDQEGWVSTDSSVLHWDGASWTVEQTVPGQVLQGLAVGGGQVYAVGGLDTVLIRFSSGGWFQAQGGPTVEDLYAVATLAPDDAWAVGANGTIVHWDGIAWRPSAAPTSANLYAVQMLSATDGYAVGGDLASGVMLHWDGTAWRVAATAPATLYGLALDSGGNGWAVGAGGTIRQANAGVWSAAGSPTGVTLNAVALDSPAHAWAVGGGLRQDAAQPALLEYTRGHWNDRTSALPAGAPGIFSLILDPGGDGWAVGNRNGSSPILRLAGGTWSLAPASAVVDLRSVAPEALGEAWAVGCAVYHYMQGTWQATAFPTNSGYCLNGLGLVPGQGGWAVGNAGKVLRYSPLAPGQRFYDVPPANPFYTSVDYMAAHGIISGYGDNTFRPFNNVTRGQLTKMVVGGLGWTLLNPERPAFADVPRDQPFYSYIETAAAHGIISGYTCGGPGEPCDPQRRPYFHPSTDLTRGQLAKIIVTAKGWDPLNPAPPPFLDVPPDSPFYGLIARAVQQGIVGGYGCGGPGEPCPGSYFRPAAPATRGQVSKILDLALTQP